MLAVGNTAVAASPSTLPSTIHLQSRIFTPEPGIESGLMARLENANGRWHGLIQFHNVPDDGQLAQLETAGVQLLNYIPHNTWLATMPDELNTLTAMPFVRWVGAYTADDKMSALITGAEMAPWVVNSDGTLNLTVVLFADVDEATAVARLQAQGATITHSEPTIHHYTVTLPPQRLIPIAEEDIVAWLTANSAPKSTQSDEARGRVNADAVQLAPYELDGHGVQAAMWDSGFADSNHADFNNRLTRVGTGSTGTHATHVAGLMGGNGANSLAHGAQTSNQWRGIAPALDILSYDWNNVIYAHDGAINSYGADLSQNSWGFSYCSYTGMYDLYAPEYDAIVTGLYGRRIPAIFAAGNLGNNNCPHHYGTILGGPQSAKNVLTVGAVNADGNPMIVPSFSSWGPTLDGRLKPEIMAPGAKSGGAILSTYPGGGYGYGTGTSQAAPIASGSMGLLLERYRQSCSLSGDNEGNFPTSDGASIARAYGR